MRHKLLYLNLLFVIICFGQNFKIDSLTSKKFNANWINELKKINTTEEKLKVIIEKIKIDSVISKVDISEKITIKADEGESVIDMINKKTKCKILFVLNQKKIGRILDLNRFPNNSLILNFLTIDNVKSIEILEHENAISIYGSNASFGVVILNSDDRKLRKAYENKMNKFKN